jgi:16S rRNA (guanine527-N7)-methyltransferase
MYDIVGLRSLLRKNNLAIGDRELELLIKYSGLLAGWNSKINLISRRDEQNIVERHIVLSLALLFRHRFAPGSSILDIGTGGGLPGIPLAIVCPENGFTLLDSIQKKMKAVENISGELQLKNVTLITGRAEDLAKDEKHRAAYDYVVSRAVSSVTDLVKWGKPLLCSTSPKPVVPGGAGYEPALQRGTIVLYKGGDLTAEFKEARLKTKPELLTEEPVIVGGIDPEYTHEKKLVIIKP